MLPGIMILLLLLNNMEKSPEDRTFEILSRPSIEEIFVIWSEWKCTRLGKNEDLVVSWGKILTENKWTYKEWGDVVSHEVGRWVEV